jgi:phosphate-selective porin OprO/OprP
MASQKLALPFSAKSECLVLFRALFVTVWMASFVLLNVSAAAQETEGFTDVQQSAESPDTAAIEFLEPNDSSNEKGEANTQSPEYGYANGFVIASPSMNSLETNQFPFSLKVNGWMQLRHAAFDSDGPNRSRNTLSLERIRLGFDGHAYTPDLRYTLVLDANSDQASEVSFLDAYFSYDFGCSMFDLRPGTLGLRAGKWKSPFSRSREESARRFQFTERSVANLFFDMGRSTGVSIFGEGEVYSMPSRFEIALINGINSGRDATISAEDLDRNFAWSGRASIDPLGPFTAGESDLSWSPESILRLGAGVAGTMLDREGNVEFARPRVVASGRSLNELLPKTVDSYDFLMFTIDSHWKVRGFSFIAEYHWRTLYNFTDGSVPTLADTGLMLQTGYFVIPEKLEFLARWSKITGDSGTLGNEFQTTNEIGTGFAWFIRDQDVKFTVDLSWIDGVPINSPRLSLLPGDEGLLLRSQLQFGF